MLPLHSRKCPVICSPLSSLEHYKFTTRPVNHSSMRQYHVLLHLSHFLSDRGSGCRAWKPAFVREELKVISVIVFATNPTNKPCGVIGERAADFRRAIVMCNALRSASTGAVPSGAAVWCGAVLRKC